MLSGGTVSRDRGEDQVLTVCVCVCTEKFGTEQFVEGEMSGDGRNPVVPVDVVQGIVSQLSEVSQHTT